VDPETRPIPFTRQVAEAEVDRDEPEEATVAVWQWSAAPHANADGMGREEPQDQTDLQARAMGLECLEDDPHTPVPSYLREYRRHRGL